MEQKSFNKVLFVLVIVAIIVSVLGTLLVLNASNFDDAEIGRHSGGEGSISLGIQGPPQTAESTGSIELSVVEKEV